MLALVDDNACPANGKAHVRFVHAAAGAPNVDVYAGLSRVFNNVAYGSIGSPSYLPVVAGKVKVSATPAGSAEIVAGPLKLQLDKGTVYTLVASGLVGSHKYPLTVIATADNVCATIKM